MRNSLLLALGAAMLLSIGSLWKAEAPHVVAASDLVRTHAVALDQDVVSRPALPAELPRLTIEPAKRDLFDVTAPSPASAATPAPIAPAPPAPPPAVPPSPQPPPLNVRFLGRMTTPGGKTLVYLQQGDAVLPVAVGDKLDGGYVVSEVSLYAVTLVHAATDTKAVVPISEPSQ